MVKIFATEIHNFDAHHFYTNGKLDYSKAVKNKVTHLIRGITYTNSKEVVAWKIPNVNVGYVYLIQADNGLTKIGNSENPEERLSQLQQNSPCQLNLYYCQFVKNSKHLEKFLHVKFASKRVRGEWFNLSADELAQAKQVLIDHEWVRN